MPDGLLALDKPQGCSSNAALAMAKRCLGVRKAGHSGTLDPLATGVLVAATGRLTRLLTLLAGADKAYRAAVRLGVTTDTLDITGRITASAPVPVLGDDALRSALVALRGVTVQAPPAFSARKIRGERAYARARRGEQVELTPRSVHIKELDLVGFQDSTLVLEVVCSSGTYVRALARDLGTALGVPAVLASLRRERVGSIGLEWARDPRAVTWGDRVPLEVAFPGMAIVRFADRLIGEARNGRRLPRPSELAGEDHVAVLDEGAVDPYDALVGVYRVEGAWLVPEMVFARES